MDVETREISDLVVYENNPRINDGAVSAVAQSLREFGWRQPVVIDEAGNVVCGHTRIKAAQKLGWTEVPCHVAKDLTPEQLRAYRIADNKTAEIAEWEVERLSVELTQLAEADFDMNTLGFSEQELNGLFDAGTAGETDPDEVPEPPAEAITQTGDVWLLGDHRLLCGDSTKAEDVDRVLSGAKPFIMVTDPPYGVEYSPSWRGEALNDGAKRREGKVENDDRVDWTDAWKLFTGDVAYVWHASLFTGDVARSLIAASFTLRAHVIWAKPRFALSRGHYHWQHEMALYCVKKGATAKWCGDRSQSTLWQIAQKDDTGETPHGTQKPVECMARPIRNHGGKDDGVYDPFVGSGTTIIAAEQLGRRCYAIEIDPIYCDVAVKRWENFTGKTAMREP